MYNREYKSDFIAKWICAPDNYLKAVDRPKTTEFENAKFIWGRRYTRTYFRRTFNVNKAVVRAYLCLSCDNLIEVYLNGKRLSSNKSDTGIVEIAPSLCSVETL